MVENVVSLSLSVFHQIVKPGCSTLLPVRHKCINEIQHWCLVMKPVLQSAFKFILKVLDGVDVRALCTPARLFHTTLGKLLYNSMDLVLCMWALSCYKLERDKHKLLTQSWKQTTVKSITVCCRTGKTRSGLEVHCVNDNELYPGAVVSCRQQLSSTPFSSSLPAPPLFCVYWWITKEL